MCSQSNISYVSTLISKSPISDVQRNLWTNTLKKLNMSVFDSKVLSDRAEDYYFSLDGNYSIDDLKKSVNSICREYNIDICLQPNDKYRREKKLVVFDMDSTLIQQEVIDMIAAYADVEDKVSTITSLAMNGKIDFNESLRRRVALLDGIPSTVFESLKKDIALTPGAKELCKALKKTGSILAVCSGGFIPLASWIKGILGLDYAFANQMEFTEDGLFLSGRVQGEIVNAEKKAQLLRHMAENGNIDLKATMAVGDGANDLVMMSAAGYGVAFNAKPIVQEQAPARLNSESLQDILYILGYSLEEQNDLLL
ncbi:HAD-like domain-containing protein [Dipodascopsis uninucleata]